MFRLLLGALGVMKFICVIIMLLISCAVSAQGQKLDCHDVHLSFDFEGSNMRDVAEQVHKLSGVRILTKDESFNELPINLSVDQMKFTSAMEFFATLLDTNLTYDPSGEVVLGQQLKPKDKHRNILFRHRLVRELDFINITDLTQDQVYNTLVENIYRNETAPDLGVMTYLKNKSSKALSVRLGPTDEEVTRPDWVLYALFDGVPYLLDYHQNPKLLHFSGLWNEVKQKHALLSVEELAEILSEVSGIPIEISSDWRGKITLEATPNKKLRVNDVLTKVSMFLELDMGTHVAGSVKLLPSIKADRHVPQESFRYEVFEKKVVRMHRVRTPELYVYPHIEEYSVSVDARSVEELLLQIKEEHDVPLLDLTDGRKPTHQFLMKLNDYRLENISILVNQHPDYRADLRDGILTVQNVEK